MPKVLFWNVQRIGAGAHEQKTDLVADVSTDMMLRREIDYLVFCEITSDIDIPAYGISLSKDGAIKKKGAQATAAQLGYACLARQGNDFNVHQLTVEQIGNVGTYFTHPHHGNPLKGGGQFLNQSMRNVVRITGTNVFAYHNNASEKAPSVLSWVAAHLQFTLPGAWVLVGDLNCSPQAFGTKFGLWKAKYNTPNLPNTNWWTAMCPGATHNAKAGLANHYDWVLHASAVGQVDVKTLPTNMDRLMLWRENPEMVPDHLPIWLTTP